MPNLINTDNAGNVFFNYITPVINGESTAYNDTMLNSFLETKLGAIGTNWTNYSSGGTYYVRLPAPGLEMKTGSVSAFGDGDARFQFEIDRTVIRLNSNNTNTSTGNFVISDSGITNTPIPGSGKLFAVVNDYALCFSVWDASLTALTRFVYLGWLREPVYDGATTGVLGLVAIDSARSKYVRPLTANDTSEKILSTAADAITSPPIVCTAGTDPGDGSETFTDIVIRDAAAPNNPVGKLWNCIDMPATCNVGELWRNTGAHDGDASASEQDTYLCVMPWGTRKLGMRVWTENVV